MKFGKENYLIEKGKSIKAHFDIKNVSGTCGDSSVRN